MQYMHHFKYCGTYNLLFTTELLKLKFFLQMITYIKNKVITGHKIIHVYIAIVTISSKQIGQKNINCAVNQYSAVQLTMLISSLFLRSEKYASSNFKYPGTLRD